MKSLCKRTISLLSWVLLIIPLVLILVFAAARLSGQVPSVFGYSLYVIVSPSMTPELKVGDIILTREYEEGNALNVGDIITYRGFSGDMAGKLITHRIVGLSEEENGLTVTAKGIANPAADPQFSAENIVSVMKCRLPAVGKIYSVLLKPWGFVLLFVVPMLWFLVSEVRELRQTVKNETGPSDEGGK